MSEQSRIDRFISKHCRIKRKDLRLLIAQGRVMIDGQTAQDAAQQINKFSHISLNSQVLQDNKPVYLMMNKPIGVLSATKDDEHPTVIDLLTHPEKSQLHIVGRLDKQSSGLLLLTNDSRWSKQLSHPVNKIEKHYVVRVKNPLTPDYIHAFEQGFYFEFEDITTRPAELKIIDEYTAQVILSEGRYHQIKRMFGRFRNPVLALHRTAIGNIKLDKTLATGQYRELNHSETITKECQ